MNNYNKDDNKPYSLVMNADSSPESGDFPNVIGYEKQKKELQLIFEWFNRSKELTERGLNIPKGAILYGEPGNGKTLLIREIVGSTNSPVLIFNGDDKNIVEGINETFKEARTFGHAIVIFDELDLLINKERRVVRALQENMDGVESNDDILVLAATNDIDEIPDALLRDGRFGKTIRIDRPTKETALAIFKKHYSDLNLQYPDDFDDEEVALSLSGLTCAALKSVVNDLALRNGFDGITLDMIEDSISNISNKERSTSKKEYFSVAFTRRDMPLLQTLSKTIFRLSMSRFSVLKECLEQRKSMKTIGHTRKVSPPSKFLWRDVLLKSSFWENLVGVLSLISKRRGLSPTISLM